MNHSISNTALSLITALLALGMASSCGGGGGGGNQIITPPPVNVQSTAIDDSKVSVVSNSPNTWDFEGYAGAAMANAEVKAVDTMGIEAFTNAAADGSFDFGPVPPPGFDVSFGTTILLSQTAPGFLEGPTVTVNVY